MYYFGEGFTKDLIELGVSNQSEILAKIIAKHFSILLCTNALERIKYTAPQSTLTQKERWTNTEHAFRIKHLDALKNKSILIIDDLLTTGATCSEIAKTLKKHNVRTVAVLTLAIAS